MGRIHSRIQGMLSRLVMVPRPLSVYRTCLFAPYRLTAIIKGLACLPLVLLLVGSQATFADELEPVERIDVALRSGDERHDHSDRPTVPQPQLPDYSTPENRDTNRSFLDWQHATDDWFGVRPWLDDRGVVFDSSMTCDLSRNFRGGVSTNRTITRHLFDLNVTVNTERLWGWQGGTLFLDFQTFNGSTGDLIVGDGQIFSNIDTVPVTQLPQMWLEQRLWDDTFRVKVGMVDANSEFAYTDHGVEFLNSSMGFSPTIFVMPTYPDPATSLNVFWEPSDSFYAGIGLYDGAGQRGVPTGSRGPRSLIGEKLFTIGEAGVRWGQDDGILPGRTAVGGWYHNGEFDAFTGGIQTGTEGWFWLLDQQLYRENPYDEDDEQELGIFLQYGSADPVVSEAHQHFGAGLAWKGLIPHRDDDTLGVAVTWVRFSNHAGLGFSTETATEVFYKLMLTKWAGITFDLQHISHPGGRAGRRDALVGTSRFLLQF